MKEIDISIWNLAASYLLVKQILTAVVRMTVQLLFVGLYLQVVFDLNNFWLTAFWVVAMVGVADISVLRSCDLKLKRLILPLFIAIITGTLIPTFFFIGPILNRPQLLDSQYAIPIAGMILGNCLRADIIGIQNYYNRIHSDQKAYQYALAQGATLNEAAAPYFRDAFKAALAPTIATIATIGLVSLPGMMTGVILAGTNPMTAIKYQIAIMLAILSGTAITVWLAIILTVKSTFTAYGNLDLKIFKE
jgi:putative ABC transport system permease protein